MSQDPTSSPPPEPPAADPLPLLVERIQRGIDYEASCERLFRQLRPRVRGLFAMRGFSADECAELTQETFIRVFTNIDKVRDPSRFLGWLFEMIVNLYRNELRRRGAAKRDAYEESLDQLSDPHGGGAAIDSLLAHGAADPSPLDDILRVEQRTRLYAALTQLPPQMRRAAELRMQDLKYREIALVLGISIETVKAHLHQALKRLRQALRGAAGDGTEGGP